MIVPEVRGRSCKILKISFRKLFLTSLISVPQTYIDMDFVLFLPFQVFVTKVCIEIDSVCPFLGYRYWPKPKTKLLKHDC